MRISDVKLRILSLGLVIASVALLSLSIPAQVKPRKKAKPLATPVPVSTGAEIISQSSDQSVIPGAQPQTDVQPAADDYRQSLPPAPDSRIDELTARIQLLESNNSSKADQMQKRLLMALDILTRAEQRSDSLRKSYFEILEKENTIRTRLDQIEFDARPEMIDRTANLAGTLRPEELRDMRRRSLESEKQNLNNMLTEIQGQKDSLLRNMSRADDLVNRLRDKLEKEIDDALDDPKKDN